jgi:energy coupling factor transporter S component ThiW
MSRCRPFEPDLGNSGVGIKMAKKSNLLNEKAVGKTGIEAAKKNAPRRLVLTSIMIALGVSLSVYPGAIPIGPTRVFPFQHMINGITGVILGPLNAALIAIGIGVLRMVLGTGTIFALAGGVPGAIVVGIAYHYLKKNDAAVLAEPIGTAIGALISALFIAPYVGTAAFPPFLGFTAQWQLFTIFFMMSSVPGAILGFIVLVALRRRGVLARLLL